MAERREGKTQIGNKRKLQTWQDDNTNLVPWMSLDLGELELGVVWIHAFDFFSCWGA